MTRLARRKTRLSLITNATVKYRGKEREVVIEVHPEIAEVRLKGTRIRYEVSWRGIHDYAARVAAERGRKFFKESRATERRCIA